MTTSIVTTSQQLRQLLLRIADSRLETCVRFRLIGQMWQTHFMQVVLVTEKGVILNNELDNKSIGINDLNAVMQFEFDQQLYQYEPYLHLRPQPTTFETSTSLV